MASTKEIGELVQQKEGLSTIDLPSDKKFLEHCFEYFEGALPEKLNKRNKEGISSSMYELISNAIIHGNKDKNKKVKIAYQIKKDCFEAMIEDEGDGFDVKDWFEWFKKSLKSKKTGKLCCEATSKKWADEDSWLDNYRKHMGTLSREKILESVYPDMYVFYHPHFSGKYEAGAGLSMVLHEVHSICFNEKGNKIAIRTYLNRKLPYIKNIKMWEIVGKYKNNSLHMHWRYTPYKKLKANIA